MRLIPRRPLSPSDHDETPAQRWQDLAPDAVETRRVGRVRTGALRDRDSLAIGGHSRRVGTGDRSCTEGRIVSAVVTGPGSSAEFTRTCPVMTQINVAW